MIKLSRIVEQQGMEGQYYDLGRDFANFTRIMDGSSDQIKKKYEQAIGAKLNGKRIRARASRGYKQYVKDYEFDVAKITLDDYYDNYVIVAHDNTTPKPKEYFLKPGFKIQILGPASGQPSPQSGKAEKNPQETPSAPPVSPQQNPDKAQSQPMTPAPVGNVTTPPEKLEEKSGYMDAYPIDSIMEDIKKWVPVILTKPANNLRDFVKGLGWIKDMGKGTTVALFEIHIPVNMIKKQFNANMMGPILNKISTTTGTITTTYKLNEMKLSDDKSNLEIKILKTMQDHTI